MVHSTFFISLYEEALAVANKFGALDDSNVLCIDVTTTHLLTLASLHTVVLILEELPRPPKGNYNIFTLSILGASFVLCIYIQTVDPVYQSALSKQALCLKCEMCIGTVSDIIRIL
jgi:hypothetical protein